MINETVTVLTRITELATQARNPVYDGFSRKAIRKVQSLRETLIDLVNARDSYGQSLFSGFNTLEKFYARSADGSVHYNGDRGVHNVQVSENVNIATGLDGETVFGRIETPNGRKAYLKLLIQ